MLAGAGGASLGYGASELLARHSKFFQEPTPGRAKTVRIILPILGGTAFMLADRYRRQMNEQYAKTKGWGKR